MRSSGYDDCLESHDLSHELAQATLALTSKAAVSRSLLERASDILAEPKSEPGLCWHTAT